MISLSKESSRYFWDVDWATLDTSKNQAFIIQRLMECGDLAEVRWLLKSYPRETLQNEMRRSRTLTPKSAALWSLLLDSPR